MKGTRDQGFSLVEVLIAGMVLVLAIVPVMGIIVQGKVNQTSDEGMAEAVTIAEDLMEKLLSPSVPFQAIDPAGGDVYAPGGPKGAVKQAGFRDYTSPAPASQLYSKATLEKLINDDPTKTVMVGANRFRYRRTRSRTYYICLFAGKYPDRDPAADTHETNPDATYKRADIDETLTFAYHEKPATFAQPFNLGADKATFNRQIILDRATTSSGAKALPYLLEPCQVSPETAALAVNPDAPFYAHDQSRMAFLNPGKVLLPGWPDPSRQNSLIKYDIDDPSSDQRTLWMQHLRAVATSTGGKSPTVAYHPSVVDQRTFQQKNGALMKLVLGVMFLPYNNSGLRRDTSTLREIWLVSLKADIES